MKIALLSFEFPPDTAIGGIGTYAMQVSKAFVTLGHHVEVFSSSPSRAAANELYDGVTVHRLQTTDRQAFRKLVLPALQHRHRLIRFDIIESPEYEAEALYLKELVKDVPLVVKFHTPGFLIKEMNRSQKAFQFKYKLKKMLHIGGYKKENDPEYKMTLMADGLSSPSESLARLVAQRWQLDEEKINIIPNCYLPPAALLDIPSATQNNCITYMGRLEARKGVHLLAEVIPAVLEKYPQTIFRFIGKTNMGPKGRGTMEGYLKKKLKPWLSNTEFISHVPLSEIPAWLAKTDICVFPSLWENFPNVCLEAMSAARGIVASQNGGMREMLEDIDGGILIDPMNTLQLQEAIIRLLQEPSQRIAMGERCRQKITRFYAKQVPEMNLSFYEKVIDQFAKRNH